MQWILSVFAIIYNKRFGYRGHVWYDRFKSKIIEGMRDFVRTFRYIMENPVHAGIVKQPWEYKFNGITYLRNKEYHIIEAPNRILLLINAYNL